MDAENHCINQKKIDNNFSSDVSFSYGLAGITGGDKLTVSDVLSIADAQMYIKKRDYHILMSKKRLREERFKNTETTVSFRSAC